MKRVLLFALLFVTPAAFAATTVLTPKGALYSVDASTDENTVSLTRRSGEAKQTLVVGTGVNAQLEYDRVIDRLYVIWTRDSDVVMSWLGADDAWAEPMTIASTEGNRSALRTALTRATVEDTRYTLIHVASWVRIGDVLESQYALVGFEGPQHYSTDVIDFRKASNLTVSANSQHDDIDEASLYPPLAIAAAGDGLDVVYGHETGTTITRVHFSSRLDPHARIWKPLGRDTHAMPPARFAAHGAPTQAFFSGDRVVLYTTGEQFRYVIFESGEWSPVRSFTLDESLKGEALVNEVRRMIAEEPAPPVEDKPVSQ